MSAPFDFAAESVKATASLGLPESLIVTPLPGVVDIQLWIGLAPPEREFLILNWIARGAAGLLSGQDGVGKSLLAQQMATAVVLSLPVLGLKTMQARATYITCEDDLAELHRRQVAINAALGANMEALPESLQLVSLKGQMRNELVIQAEGDGFEPSPRYEQIRAAVRAHGSELVFLDNAAHFFPGNENSRHEVAEFLALLEQLSIEINGAVVLLAHPNKAHGQGATRGNEYSGSTGWSAHVRNRLFIGWASDEGDAQGGEAIDPDARILRRSKANYAARGEEISFRWHKGAFVRDGDLPRDQRDETAAVVRANSDNELFLRCLDERNRQQRPVSESKHSRTYAPKEFAAMPESKRIGQARLQSAMDRLFRIGEIERGFIYRDGAEGKDRQGLRRTSKESADLPAELPPTVSADVPLTARRLPPSRTCISKDIYGAAIKAAAPSSGQSPRVRNLNGMILASGENGNEPVDSCDI